MSASDDEKQAAAMAAVTFEEFAPTQYDEWKQAAVAALKGGIFEKRMYTSTYEGIQLEPIYTMEHARKFAAAPAYPGSGDFVRGVHAGGYLSAPWKIAQQCAEALPAEFNAIAKHELAKGSTSLHIALDSATFNGLDAVDAPPALVGDRGVSLSTLHDGAQALDGIGASNYELHIHTGCSNVGVLPLIAAVAKAHGQSYQGLHGCIGADPIGVLAGCGRLPRKLDRLYDEMAQAAVWAGAHTPALRTVFVDGHVYHDGGANAVQEIAYAMTTAIEYIRQLQQRGLSANEAAANIRFGFSLGSNFFMEIAKLRAARSVWAQIIKAFGGDQEAQKINIHARTSLFTKTVYDPYVNMLRTMTEAFSGVVGGVDSLYVGCFDETVRPNDSFGRRIARNTQLLLQNECNLMQPVDPAGGSWYVETLTRQVAESAWNSIQQIDQQGGIVKALQTGAVQKELQAVLQARFKNLARRSDRAVGINMYANAAEQPLEKKSRDKNAIRSARISAVDDYRQVIDEEHCKQLLQQVLVAANGPAGELIHVSIQAFEAGATIGEINQLLNSCEENDIVVEPIQARRWSEQFEALRDRTLRYKAQTGDTITVFLANMGPIPQHKARAEFATGFMEVAGFEVLTNDGFATVEQAAQAALAVRPDVVVVCSTDDTYPELVPPLARLLAAANPGISIVLAGAPAPELEDVYRQAGVDEFIHMRANCYQILSELQQAKGMDAYE